MNDPAVAGLHFYLVRALYYALIGDSARFHFHAINGADLAEWIAAGRMPRDGRYGYTP